MKEVEQKLLDLKIPIDSYVDCHNYIEIIYNNQNVGVVPSYPTPGNRIIDTTSPDVLTNFRWEFIYGENKKEIDKLVAGFLKVEPADLEITLSTFRRLYVKDTDRNLIGLIDCSFENGGWAISNVHEE